MIQKEFSHQTRKRALENFGSEIFDFLIIGGGITGAAVARDATRRGLKVALVERNDFASGTSCRSSKLIHGGLRYLENFELRLVFEALAERSHLLATAPHMVRPLPFYLPVYRGDLHSKSILDIGLWLYDMLSLFRTPGFHKRLSQKKMLALIPALAHEGLKGGFKYYDASMWDDVLAIQTLRSAVSDGAQVANYVEALDPIRNGKGRICGFKVRDHLTKKEIPIKAKQVISCVGPWSDELGPKIENNWKTFLAPSKGVHLVFDLKRLSLPGAMVMSHPKDGRISFVIPRPDFGAGVTIVGTTDGPSPRNPDEVDVTKVEVAYLMELLHRYFPKLNLTESDIISSYVGVRPLVKPAESATLSKVSREHTVHSGEGGVIWVGGGKYTTHRKMAEEIVDLTLKDWRKHAEQGVADPLPKPLRDAETEAPVNPYTTPEVISAIHREKQGHETKIEAFLIDFYGSEVQALEELNRIYPTPELEGFPWLGAQLAHSIRTGAVIQLEDFYFRRQPLFMSRKDHGLPLADRLSEIWARELGAAPEEAKAQVVNLKNKIAQTKVWS